MAHAATREENPQRDAHNSQDLCTVIDSNSRFRESRRAKPVQASDEACLARAIRSSSCHAPTNTGSLAVHLALPGPRRASPTRHRQQPFSALAGDLDNHLGKAGNLAAYKKRAGFGRQGRAVRTHRSKTSLLYNHPFSVHGARLYVRPYTRIRELPCSRKKVRRAFARTTALDACRSSAPRSSRPSLYTAGSRRTPGAAPRRALTRPEHPARLELRAGRPAAACPERWALAPTYSACVAPCWLCASHRCACSRAAPAPARRRRAARAPAGRRSSARSAGR